MYMYVYKLLIVNVVFSDRNVFSILAVILLWLFIRNRGYWRVCQRIYPSESLDKFIVWDSIYDAFYAVLQQPHLALRRCLLKRWEIELDIQIWAENPSSISRLDFSTLETGSRLYWFPRGFGYSGWLREAALLSPNYSTVYFLLAETLQNTSKGLVQYSPPRSDLTSLFNEFWNFRENCMEGC